MKIDSDGLNILPALPMRCRNLMELGSQLLAHNQLPNIDA